MRRVQECPIRRKRKKIISCCLGFPALSISPYFPFLKVGMNCLLRDSNQFLQKYDLNKLPKEHLLGTLDENYV
jgi:hypothetical protein